MAVQTSLTVVSDNSDDTNKALQRKLYGLDDLPAEIIYIIISFSTPSDIARLSRTCRFLHVLAFPLVLHNMDVSYSPGDGKLQRMWDSLFELAVCKQLPWIDQPKLSYVRHFRVHSLAVKSWTDAATAARAKEHWMLTPFISQTLPRALAKMTELETWQYVFEV